MIKKFSRQNVAGEAMQDFSCEDDVMMEFVSQTALDPKS